MRLVSSIVCLACVVGCVASARPARPLTPSDKERCVEAMARAGQARLSPDPWDVQTEGTSVQAYTPVSFTMVHGVPACTAFDVLPPSVQARARESGYAPGGPVLIALSCGAEKGSCSINGILVASDQPKAAISVSTAPAAAGAAPAAPAAAPSEAACGAVLDHVIQVMDGEPGLVRYAAHARGHRSDHIAACTAHGTRQRHDCLLAASTPRALTECGIRVSMTDDTVQLFDQDGQSQPVAP